MQTVIWHPTPDTGLDIRTDHLVFSFPRNGHRQELQIKRRNIKNRIRFSLSQSFNEVTDIPGKGDFNVLAPHSTLISPHAHG